MCHHLQLVSVSGLDLSRSGNTEMLIIASDAVGPGAGKDRLWLLQAAYTDFIWYWRYSQAWQNEDVYSDPVITKKVALVISWKDDVFRPGRAVLPGDPPHFLIARALAIDTTHARKARILPSQG
jgi:hypothetical protein